MAGMVDIWGAAMNASAPIEFIQIGLDPHAFKYSDEKSWRGPCPECGGNRRYVVFTDHEFPCWYGFCSLCGIKNKYWLRFPRQYDPEKAARMKAEQELREREEAEKRRRKLAAFTTAELWAELHERMTREHVLWWEDQGVPEEIQNYLKIGYTPDKPYYNDDETLCHSPAYTIPWFGYGFAFQTMQYRLFADVDRRYIFEHGLGGGRHYYMTTPDKPITDKVIICEGAKKAINTWLWLAPPGYTVLAASSANTFDAALEVTKDCGLRYVVFDPDVKPYWRQKAIATNPKSTHDVRLPYKVDDGCNQYGLDRITFTRILDMAL